MRTHVAAALLLLPLFAARQAAAQSLAGMVLDVHTRAPMANVHVRLATDSGDVVAIDTSRADGVFYLNAARAGRYLVVFQTASGVALLAPQPVTLQADSAKQVQYLLDLSEGARPSAGAGSGDDDGHIYSAAEVDVPAKPIMPAVASAGILMGSRRGASGAQLAASSQGSATAEFVVDSTGRILSETVRIIETTGDDATRRLTRMLPQLRYEPAVKDGRRVRQRSRWGLALRSEAVVRRP